MENHELAVSSNNATDIYQRMANPMEAIKEMGQMFASSGMFGCTKLEQGQVLALACLIEGKSPFELMRNYHIIGGNLTMKSVAVLAEFQKKGGNATWHSKLNDTEQASATFEFHGETLVEAVYSIDDARREGLIAGPNKHNWTARPADMLRARLITKAIRMLAPAVIMGISEDTDPIVVAPVAPLLEKPVVASVTTDNPQPGVEDLIESNKEITIEAATAFLREVGMLNADEEIVDLNAANRKRILKGWPAFCEKVREHGKLVEPAEKEK